MNEILKMLGEIDALTRKEFGEGSINYNTYMKITETLSEVNRKLKGISQTNAINSDINGQFKEWRENYLKENLKIHSRTKKDQNDFSEKLVLLSDVLTTTEKMLVAQHTKQHACNCSKCTGLPSIEDYYKED